MPDMTMQNQPVYTQRYMNNQYYQWLTFLVIPLFFAFGWLAHDYFTTQALLSPDPRPEFGIGGAPIIVTPTPTPVAVPTKEARQGANTQNTSDTAGDLRFEVTGPTGLIIPP